MAYLTPFFSQKSTGWVDELTSFLGQPYDDNHIYRCQVYVGSLRAPLLATAGLGIAHLPIISDFYQVWKGLSLSRDKTTNTFFLLQSRCPFLSLQNVIQSSWGSSFQSGQHLETLFDRPVGYDLASFYLTIVFWNCISVFWKKCNSLCYFS